MVWLQNEDRMVGLVAVLISFTLADNIHTSNGKYTCHVYQHERKTKTNLHMPWAYITLTLRHVQNARLLVHYASDYFLLQEMIHLVHLYLVQKYANEGKLLFLKQQRVHLF